MQRPVFMRKDGELRSLGWGFAVCVLLVLVTAVSSFAEVSRVRGELMQLIAKGERSSFLVGDIGRRLSKMRLLLREATSAGQQPGPDFPALAIALRTRVEELGPLLERKDIQLWDNLARRISSMHDRLLEAAAAVRRGQTEQAGAFLDRLLTDESQIMTDLALLSLLEREATDEALLGADDYLQKLKIADVIVASLLMLGVSLTWWVVIRIVHRQRKQLNLEMARVKLANEDLNAFAGRIAHDLTDVLTPLLLVVASMKRADSAGMPVMAERIEQVSSRAFGLLDALLSFSRAGARSASDASCSVLTELRAVLEELAPIAKRVDARIEVAAAGEDSRVRCSAGLLGIVIRNIVSNALKALHGRPSRVVRIEVSTREKDCCIAISDTGPGIPQELLDRIFEPFYRVPGTSTHGTGIGLATVQRVLQAHDGDIAVRSRPGEGARFEVTLPRVRPLARPSQAEAISLAV